jgi:hypothetical protein
LKDGVLLDGIVDSFQFLVVAFGEATAGKAERDCISMA